jgi:hypothetical protein
MNRMFEPPPWNELLGHVRPRGGPAGLVVRGGRIVAEWGDTHRPDVTFSVAKSFVSTCVGLAWARAERRAPADIDGPNFSCGRGALVRTGVRLRRIRWIRGARGVRRGPDADRIRRSPAGIGAPVPCGPVFT